jgi:hypothetical protein
MFIKADARIDIILCLSLPSGSPCGLPDYGCLGSALLAAAASWAEEGGSEEEAAAEGMPRVARTRLMVHAAASTMTLHGLVDHGRGK